MIGPTGVGKTEIARRLAKLAGSPFFKVEATKFTEVGYVGRDVESMVRDLMEIGINLVRKEELARVAARAEKAAEERLLDLLLPESSHPTAEAIELPAAPETPTPTDATLSTRDKLRKLWREGKLDDRMVPVEVQVSSPQVEILSMPGMEDMGMQFKDMFSKVFPQRKKTRNM